MQVLREWSQLPQYMQTEELRPYYEILQSKRAQLVIKRVFDVTAATSLMVVLSLPMAIISVLIKADSEGPVFYRQERVTSYGQHFRIHKFRTMVKNADAVGSSVTIKGDSRITRIGNILRKTRLDEIPQLIDVLHGDMSFVGTRPESPKYVVAYAPEYYATLILPAGITSEASIAYRNEAELLSNARNVDEVYVNEVLPSKMAYNLDSIRQFSCARDVRTMVRTVLAVAGLVK